MSPYSHPSPSRAAKRKSSTHGRTKGRGKSVRLQRRIPLWAFGVGGAVLVGLYLLFVYHFLVGPHSFRWWGEYPEPTYPEGYDIRGLDISHYQGHIDWERLRNASLGNDPIRFVFIKATEGETLLDENFNANFYQSRKNDFVRGTYHFYVPSADAEKQALFYLHQVHLEPGDLPPVLDVEQIGKLTAKQLRAGVKKWLDIVENHYGVKPILYSGYKFKLQYLSGEEFAEYPYWIAHYYVPQLEYQGEWAFWQHTDRGLADGIEGRVDCNIFNGTQEQLLQLTIQEEKEVKP